MGALEVEAEVGLEGEAEGTALPSVVQSSPELDTGGVGDSSMVAELPGASATGSADAVTLMGDLLPSRTGSGLAAANVARGSQSGRRTT